MNRYSASLGSALLALMVSGCGGGGGGGAPAPPPGISATGTINSASVLAISGRSVDAVIRSGNFGDITNVVGLTTMATGEPANFGAQISTKPGGWHPYSLIPVGPETTPCLVDGTVTVSGDIDSPLTVTPGDFLDYEWDSCDDGLGQVIDGLIGMTFTDFEGNLLAGQILLNVSLDIQSFQVIEGGNANTTTGDLSLTIDSRTQPETTITTLVNSLTTITDLSTDTVSDFLTAVTEDTSVFPRAFTTDATGRVSSSEFNGFVTYDTPTPFESSGDSFPYDGEMLIFGTNNSNVRIIAMDEENVRIEADYDGDGASDATIDTTWEALVGS